MGHDGSRDFQLRSPEKEQQFKIQQAKANDSYPYIKEQFNKELSNLKIKIQKVSMSIQ